MKKIVFIIPHLAGGGAEHVAATLSRYFPENVETVFTLFEDKIEYDYRGRVILLNLKSEEGIIKKIVNIFRRYFKLKKIIKAEKPDAVISFMESSNFLNVLCNPGGAIVSVRAHPSVNYKNDPFNRMIVRSYNFAKKIISVSSEIREDLVDNFGIGRDKIKVIYNPADTAEVEKMASVPLEPEDEKIFSGCGVIITAGRMNNQKNHASLIRAFHMAMPYIEGAKLVILGRGELEQDLKKLAADLNISDKVYFPGFQKNPYKFIARSRLFVLSSLYEGFPNTLIEAMICKTPLVSSRCPSGPAEIFDGAGFNNLFEPGDCAAMASRMITFYKRDNKDMISFYEKKLSELSKEKIAAEYLEACGICLKEGMRDERN
ncbi:MAG TPA: glycosyltransferase [Candidatus Wallbacteria bacterium]|nr:glycosyltransferase [Candidatus Wallbacteria bacterium]